jgi:hypothetical protein
MAAQIHVDRAANAWIDRARAYKLVVDGQPIGEIRRGESKVFDVPAGAHEVNMKIDWALSPPVALDLPEGGSARLQCRPRANLLTVLWYTIFARKRYLVLEQIV